MSLRLAQRHLGEGTVDVDGVLDRAVAELGTAVVELRQIAHGLRPSSLDDGLDRALGALVSTDAGAGDARRVGPRRCRPIWPRRPTTWRARRWPTPSSMRAPASIGVRVSHDGQHVTVTIRDDGEGGAVVRPGTGLAGLADRVAAAGGRLLLSSPRGGGTTVEAVLPCAS